MFAMGAKFSEQESLNLIEKKEEGLLEFKMMFGDDLRGGLDIFQGPPRPIQGSVRTNELGDGDVPREESAFFRKFISREDLTDVEREEFDDVQNKLRVIIHEVESCHAELFNSVITSYKDVLMSDWYVLSG